MSYQSPTSMITNDPSSNSKWMLDYHIGEMVKAEGEKNWWKYWIEFKFVLERMLAYISPDDRKKIDDDLRILEKYTRGIDGQVGTDQKTKDIQTEKLRLNFISSHRAYTGLYLPKTGLIQVEESGELNFQKQDFIRLTRVIRAGAAPSQIDIATSSYEKEQENIATKEQEKANKEEAQEATDGKPDIKPGTEPTV